MNDLKNAIADFETLKETTNYPYIAIVKNDYTKKESNRINAVEFEVITGHDDFDAIEQCNNDESHDFFIDTDNESEIFFELYI